MTNGNDCGESLREITVVNKYGEYDCGESMTGNKYRRERNRDIITEIVSVRLNDCGNNELRDIFNGK